MSEILTKTGEVIFKKDGVKKEDIFREAVMAGTKNFDGADLGGSDIEGLSLYGLSLVGANLCMANFVRTRVEYCFFTEADLNHATFNASTIIDSYFPAAELDYVRFGHSSVRDSQLTNIDGRGLSFEFCDVYHCDFNQSRLEDMSIGYTDFSINIFTDVDFGTTFPNIYHSRIYNSNTFDDGVWDRIRDRVTILPEGEIVGWKKCRDNVIVKLLIPAEARRSCAGGRKCRAEFARVTEVVGAEYGVSMFDGRTTYFVGETIKPDYFSDNWQIECDNGIHFFITRAEAEKYHG